MKTNLTNCIPSAGFILLLAGLTVLLVAVPQACADKIGVNLEGGFFPTGLTNTEIAGVVTQQFWNNVGSGSASAMPLEGDGGGSIPVDYSGFKLTCSSSGSSTTSIADNGGNSRLMKGYAVGDYTSLSVGTAVQIAVSNVPSQLTSTGYAVIVYFDYGNGSVWAVDQITLNAANYGMKTIFGLDKADTDFSGSFKQVPASSTADLGASTPDGNYAVFSGLTDTNFTLTVTPGSNGGLGGYFGFINGFQIVPANAISGSSVPVITSSLTATGTVNVAFSYTIAADNNPTGYGASGLPPGLSLNPASGLISGIPTVPGDYSVTLNATNAAGVGTQRLDLIISTGVSLTQPNSGTTNSLTDGSLLDITNGLIAGDNGTLLSTTNGGWTWGLIDVGLTNDLLAVYGIGGYEFVAGTFGLIEMSPDGGQTWTNFDLPVTNSFDSFSFLTPFWGYAVGSDGIISFWNGSSWALQSSGTTENFYGVDVVDFDIAYVVGGGGAICRFDGSLWQLQNSGTTSVTFYGVDFLSANFGYAVGTGGAIYRTINGGTNWVAQNSGTSVTLRSVCVEDANTAWAVGDNGVFLQTTDGGAHWTQISLNTSVTLYSIQFLNGRGIICGSGGVVYVFLQSGITLNQSPFVSMLTPTNQASFFVCSKTPLVAFASDPDGYISNLQLLMGTNILATSADGSVGFIWTNDTFLGSVTCVAKATDNSGASAFSSPVTFTVILPPTNQLVALGLMPTNAFEFCVCGLTGRVFAVQTSTNLLNHWTAWKTVTNGVGFIPVKDWGVSTNAQKFYRAGLATDLAQVNASLNSTSPAPGDTVTASITITNQDCSGTSVKAGKFHVGFYWSTDSSFADVSPFYEAPVNGCAANGSVTINQDVVIDSTTAPGTYYLGFSVNDENEVPECDVDNNGIWYWTITVQ